ncbi:MAG: amidase [Solirubrobacterales bacterium]|nr:amidase [Solirubrobacterales bacterium]
MDATTELAYAGIAQQARLIAAGEVSSRELVELCLGRIERFDPQLGAFRVVFAERALLEAQQADARRGAGEERPLGGVPLAVKDEMDVAGEATTMGTDANPQPARADAEVVRRLREAGAVVIGKTKMPELGMYPMTQSATWGVTRNPWDTTRSPGGSSGGSAAAVAAGLVGGALAADGGGSIRVPAAYCGLVGVKPQRGRVPLAPHLDAWYGLVVNGVLTRSVEDTALFLDAVAGAPHDPGGPAPPDRPFVRAAHEPAGRWRIAVATRLPPSPLARLDPANRAAVSETAELLRALGHEVREHEIDYGAMTPPPEFTVRYLRGVYDEVGALGEPERLERRTRAMARLGSIVAPALVRWSRAREAQLAARYNEALRDHDVLLTPVTPAPAPRAASHEGLSWLRASLISAATVAYLAPWNLTGQPAASVPAGFDEQGLPRAVQLIARPDEEATLLSLAAQLEGERGWVERRPAAFA